MAGTITQVKGLKAFIILIWLLVPVSGYLLARDDYNDYLDEARIQRADCEARADLLGRYTRLFGQRAAQLPNIMDADSRSLWQSRWRQAQLDYADEDRRLRRTTPSHYPQTDYELTLLEQLLASQQLAIESAARERDAYNKAGGGLEEMLQEIRRAEGIADYYASIGAFGISDLIYDDARLLEKEFRSRLRERKRRLEDMESDLLEAQQHQSNIAKGLSELADSLAVDEQSTYSAELHQRYDGFNLLDQLLRSLGMPPQNPPPQPTR